MVENSLGRIWTDIKPDSDLKNEWKYYLPEAEQSEEVQSKLLEMRQAKSQTSPEEITFLDKTVAGLIQKKDLKSA